MKKILFAAIVLAAGMMVSCKNSTDPSDPQDGKIDPSSICQANLIAYFPFDGNATEQINNMVPTKVGEGVAYEKGRRGQAYKGAAKNELVYNAAAIKRIAEMKDFSFACWLKHEAIPQSQAPVPWLFGFTDPTEFWGQMAFVLERGGEANTDSLHIKVAINGNKWADPGLRPELTPGRWMHIVGSFKVVNDTLQTLDVYVNGAAVEALHWDFANAPMVDFSTTTMLLFGQWRQKAIDVPAATDEWMGDMDGDLDEVRLYNTALSAEEAKALYDAEVSVID